MISRSKYLVCAVLLCCATAINLKHFQQSDDYYASSLKVKQSLFEQNIKRLGQIVGESKDSLETVKSLKEKISILENSIIDEEGQAYLISSDLIPALNLSKSECKKFTDEQMKEVIQKIDKTLKKLNDFEEKIEDIENSVKKDELEMDINNQRFYLEAIKQTVYTKCQSGDLIVDKIIYQTNLKVNNWVLGKQTTADLSEQYLSRSRSFDNVANCPVETPFFATKCISCQHQEVFDMKAKECIQCSSGVNEFNQCSDSQQSSAGSSTDSNSDDQYLFMHAPTKTNLLFLKNIIFSKGGTLADYFIRKEDVQCFSEMPYYNGSDCIECPNLFDSKSKKCSDCKQWQEFNEDTHSCQ